MIEIRDPTRAPGDPRPVRDHHRRVRDPARRARRADGQVRQQPARSPTSRRTSSRQAWGLDQPIPIQYCRWMGFCNPETEGTFLGSLPHAGRVPRPHGLAELPADGPERRHQRRAPRRLRLLDQLRREGERPHRARRRCRRSSSPASRWSSGSRSRSCSASTRPSTATRCSTTARRCSRTSASRCPRSGWASC